MNSRPLSLRLIDSESNSHSDVSSDASTNRHQRTVAHVESFSASELGSELESIWLQIQSSSKTYESPYYHPEFTKAVAAVRDDVEIGVFSNSLGEAIGILPFQRTSPHAAEPIGGRMNDFHGIIAADRIEFDLSQIVKQLNLQRFRFHALSSYREPFDLFSFETLPSFYIDLTQGFENYWQWAKSHSRTIKRMPQKVRALQRNWGSLRFEFDCGNIEVLEYLIELKREKFKRTNTFDILSVKWTAELLREIANRKRDGFKGLLSALWAGDQLVATHFGMLTDDVLHYWFPVYDPRFAKYSPGTQLMLETCRAAARSGIERIDMSYGESPFKTRFCNGNTEVRIGSVNFSSLKYFLAKHRYFTRNKLKQMPMKNRLKYFFRKVFPNYGSWHFK